MSCVANSGLRREETFVKVAGHQRRLWSVEPQLQQRTLYCIHGVLSEKGRRQGLVCIEHIVCDGADNVIIFVIKGPEAIGNSKGVPTGVGM